jgi:hypothetical protein
MSLNKRVTKLEGRVGHLEDLNTPGQENETPDSPENHSTEEGYTAPRQQPSVSKIPSPPNNSRQPKQRWYKTMRGWKVVLEIIAIPFALGYAVITYFQWRDLRHNFEAEQRAWLKVETIVPFEVHESMQTNVIITNVGKSPALRSAVDASYQVLDSKRAPTFYPDKGRFAAFANMIFPMDHADFSTGTMPFNDDGTARNLSSAEIAALLSGDSYMAIWGVVSYIDQFGLHWTRFCSWKSYQQGPHDFEARACTNYNAVGDGPVPEPQHKQP